MHASEHRILQLLRGNAVAQLVDLVANQFDIAAEGRP